MLVGGDEIMERFREKLAVITLLLFLLLSTSCNPDQVINEYFAKAGLNRLAAARTDIQPGGLILVNEKGALYVDNMLDYLPDAPKNEYSTITTNEMSQYLAVLRKYTQDRSMDVKTAFGFVQSFLPLDLESSLNIKGKVNVDLINAQVSRMKVPTVRAFLNSPDSVSFRQAIQEFTSDKKTQAYLVYEVWKTNKLKITTNSGSDISAGIKVKGDPMPLKLSSGEGKFTYKRTTDTELLISGDTNYVFAIRTGKLEPGARAGDYILAPMKFVPPKEAGIKGGAADDDVSYSAPLMESYKPVTLVKQ